ncbi:MaoC/PaaZ C-terminal domain-containing protein [Peptoniphilus equinus]|uniref:MaoC/PaaZ C-terminal domain-containing protein n=1 Tax=Peptoniphilus equinus TaxID=3016343 RepID=A0ABY7QSR4_9FIRM|nr:MaoC/PaaZ C-terminal domain-containing protein [Peptoniphilus equinus]WBW49833.1 MaoC/PaaZ C-terminal domain-containing protein [Peptoniphilus equinus]
MYLEDYIIGRIYPLKSVYITKDMIIDYAKAFDPRPFHLSPTAAEATQFGRLFASGFMTLNLCWLQWINTGLDEAGMICGIGLDELRWLAPVYADDRLFPEVEITAVSPSATKLVGSVEFTLRANNQDNTPVLSCKTTALIKKRHYDQNPIKKDAP